MSTRGIDGGGTGVHRATAPAVRGGPLSAPRLAELAEAMSAGDLRPARPDKVVVVVDPDRRAPGVAWPESRASIAVSQRRSLASAVGPSQLPVSWVASPDGQAQQPVGDVDQVAARRTALDAVPDSRHQE